MNRQTMGAVAITLALSLTLGLSKVIHSGPVLGLAILTIMAVVGTAIIVRRNIHSSKEVRLWAVTLIGGVVATAILAAIGVLIYGFQEFKHDSCAVRVSGRGDTRTYDYTLNQVINVLAKSDKYTVESLAPGLPPLADAVPKPLTIAECPGHP